MLYVGLDVHRSVTTGCILNARGSVRKRFAVQTTKVSLRRALASARGKVRIACESGPMACWIAEVLRTRHREVIVCDRRRTRLATCDTKNDRFDAEMLAELLRTGKQHPVYVPAPALAVVRRLAYHHERMVKERMRIAQRLRSLFQEHGIRVSLPRSTARRLPVRQLRDPASQSVARAYLTQLESATTLVVQARAVLIAAASEFPAYSLLQTIPYIGEIRSAQLIGIVGEPARFGSLRRFWAYGGLGVVQRSSSDHHIESGRVVLSQRARGVRLQRSGNRLLKKILRDVALYASVGRGEFRRLFNRHVARGKSAAVARLALARKIAAVVLAVWRSGLSYDVSLLRRVRNKGIRGEHHGVV